MITAELGDVRNEKRRDISRPDLSVTVVGWVALFGWVAP
jgi:hypothetical protein